MEIIELSIQWRSGARVHHLTIDAAGVPRLDADPPTDDASWYPVEPYEPPPRRPQPARLGKAWTAEDEAILRDGFAAEEPTAALAERLGRSRGAVTARLVKLGLVDEREAGLRYPVHPPRKDAASGTEASEASAPGGKPVSEEPY